MFCILFCENDREKKIFYGMVLIFLRIKKKISLDFFKLFWFVSFFFIIIKICVFRKINFEDFVCI